eukprot:5125779-Pleurochrysis_carterae.AAC.1
MSQPFAYTSGQLAAARTPWRASSGCNEARWLRRTSSVQTWSTLEETQQMKMLSRAPFGVPPERTARAGAACTVPLHTGAHECQRA